MQKLGTILAALVTGVALFTLPNVAFAGYSAIAASSNGSAFVSGRRNMEDARAAAIERCREKWGGSCDKTTAERDSWYFAAGDCDGTVYTAASADDWGAAVWLVRDKAKRDGNYNCRIFARH